VRTLLTLTFAVLLASPAPADTVEANASAHVAASPERVLALLADFDSWGRVFRSVETLSTERCAPQRARVRQRVHRAGLTFAYTLAATVDPAARRVDLQLDPSEPSDMELVTSTWRVDPHPDGGAFIQLRVQSRTRLRVPAFLERRIAESTARDSLDELVRALEHVAALGSAVGES